jgi:hypothetical protein
MWNLCPSLWSSDCRCNNLHIRSNGQVRVIPEGYSAVPPPNAMIVLAGDPRLGGVLCGNCKGSGRVVALLFFDDNCPMYVSPLYTANLCSCRGVGRIR